MPTADTLNPDGNQFDPFLFALVGQDSRGADVTVASALARLGFDPWKEAEELAALGHDKARARLGTNLAMFKDVPALYLDYGSVAADLVMKLPKRLAHRGTKTSPARTMLALPAIPARWLLVLAFGVVVLGWVYFLAQTG